MKNKSRDDFTKSIKDKLATRVAYICSNPSCHKLTIGPNTSKGNNCIGVAAHICAAAPGGPRYNKSMSESDRKSIDNGIWLCQSCSRIIDIDVDKYPVETLKEWKKNTEDLIMYNFNSRINLNRQDKLDYIFDVLKDTNNWSKIQDEYKRGYYFKENPSYMIEIEKVNNHNTEFYSYLMTNDRTTFDMLYIKYNGTCIYSTQIVTLDSGRLTTIVPSSSYVEYKGTTYKYNYFIKNDKEYVLRNFLYNFDNPSPMSEKAYAMKNLCEVVIVFNSEEEKTTFEKLYLTNIEEIELLDYCNGYNYAGNSELEIKVNKISIGLGKYLKQKYEKEFIKTK